MAEKPFGLVPHLVVKGASDAIAFYKKAFAAEELMRMEAQDMFWGARYGQITDPAGHTWSFATPLKK